MPAAPHPLTLQLGHSCILSRRGPSSSRTKSFEVQSDTLFVLHFLGENDPENLLPRDSCLLEGLIFLCLKTILPLVASFLHRKISPREEIEIRR